MRKQKCLFGLPNVLRVGLLCTWLFSAAAAQEFVSLDFDSDSLYQPLAVSREATIKNLPSGVLGKSTDETMASMQDYTTEDATIQRADAIVMVGVAGALLAGLSAAGLLYVSHRKAKQQLSPAIRITGI